jgi:hypothetical protein
VKQAASKKPRIPKWQERLAAEAKDLSPVDSELLSEGVAERSDVRFICPEHLENKALQFFDREGILYPANWRGTKFGKRGGRWRQYGFSVAIIIPENAISLELAVALVKKGAKLKNGIVTLNSFDYAHRLLVDGRAFGWKISKAV